MILNQNDIVELLRRQDKEAISILYDHYAAALYGIILKIVHREEIAQDVLQESFVKIWKNGVHYDASKGSLFTWMLNIARNAAIDKTRSRHYKNTCKHVEVGHEVSNGLSWSMVPKPEHIGLKRVMNELDEKYKIIIELIYFKGYTQQEVQEQLDIPLGTVKSRLRIGLRELRKFFDIQNISIIILFILP